MGIMHTYYHSDRESKPRWTKSKTFRLSEFFRKIWMVVTGRNEDLLWTITLMTSHYSVLANAAVTIIDHWSLSHGWDGAWCMELPFWITLAAVPRTIIFPNSMMDAFFPIQSTLPLRVCCSVRISNVFQCKQPKYGFYSRGEKLIVIVAERWIVKR